MKPFACALLLAGTVSAAALEADVKFFVSPNGSDRNSGSAAQPFRTLHRAAEAAAGRIGLELKIMVSFGLIVIFLCVPFAIRDKAAMDSP